jgi:hypothetical protein
MQLPPVLPKLSTVLVGLGAIAFLGFGVGVGVSQYFNGQPILKQKDANDVRIEQTKKCNDAGMKPSLNRDDMIICTPDYGYQRIMDFMDTKIADRVIEQEMKKRGLQVPPLPENPNSFEVKSKRTQ